MKRTLKLPQLVRSVPIESFTAIRAEGAAADAPATYRISVSSEAEVARWFGTEILSHDAAAIDLARSAQGISVRDDHFGDQVGIATDPEIKDRKLYYTLRFSQNARGQEIERDMVDGIRRFVSIRYNPLRAKLVESGTDGGKPDRWLVTRWEPIHVAPTPDPADYSVGPGRSEAEGEMRSVIIEAGEAGEEDRSMCTTCNQATCVCSPAERAQPAAAAGTNRNAGAGGNAPAATIEVGEDQAIVRSLEVLALANEHGMGDRAAGWIKDKLTPDQVSRSILKLQKDAAGVTVGAAPSERLVDMPDKDASRYSYVRAIKQYVASLEGSGEIDGVEGEQHREIAKKLPQGYAARGGLFLPMRLRSAAAPRTRALDSKTAGAGAEAVFDQPSSEIIELLRNQSVTARLGARMLAGLTAPVPFLKVTGASTGYWVGENPAASVASSAPQSGLTHLAPKTIQANVPYSRQFLALAGIDVESWVRDDLSQVHALAIDRAALHGIGAAGEPVGIYNADSVQIKSVTNVPTYANVVDVTGLAADKNALRGSLGWAATPLLAAAMKRTPVISGAAAGFVWDGTVDEGTVAGYRAVSSNQLSKVLGGGGDEHGCIFGNWADLIIGMWGAMEVIVDPFALKKTGMIEITTFQMADVMIRHGESFVKLTGAKPA